MTNTQIANALLHMIGEDNENNVALIRAAIIVLEREEKPKPKPEPVKAPEKKKTAPKTEKKPFDIGKAVACYKAGRTISWIADEMGVSAVTVSNHLKKAGVKK